MNKEQIEKELEECRFRLKEFNEKGLDLYLNSEHRDLLSKWIKEKLESDIEFFKNQLKEESKI